MRRNPTKILSEIPKDRFFKHVLKTDHCWIWTGWTYKGYGRFHFNGALRRAHRISWIIHNGPIPADKLVCHNCSPLKDNPACVNPSHLWLGSHTENMHDSIKKGTFVFPSWIDRLKK